MNAPRSVDPDLHTLRWPLLPVQQRLVPWLPAIRGGCEVAARLLRRPRLEGRDNTRRCYETLFDPLCADTGVWPDYTEGHYPEDGEASYEDAQVAQLDFLLDHTEVGKGTRLLDLGCGNGNLVRRAAERGAEASGITISRTQAASCRADGLDVHVCSFDEAPAMFGDEAFDVIVMNGPTEHFVSQEDAAAGRGPEILATLFEAVARMLRPGGRLFITCIHFRWKTDPAEVVKRPLEHEVGSYYFHCSVLVDIYSGWYPELGTYEALAAERGVQCVREWDATRDYYLTSKQWSSRLKGYLAANKGFAARYLAWFFWQDPRYFYTALLFWFYDPWTWQFRPTHVGPTPMVHKWLLFEKRSP